jgi:two-component system, NarL family, nitrate/nitrite response regulator NarL
MRLIETQPVRVLVIAPAFLGWIIEQVIEEGRPHIVPAGQFCEFAEALEFMQSNSVHVVLTVLPDSDSKLLSDFCSKSAAKVIAITADAEDGRLDGAIRAGVRGLVGLSDPVEAVHNAIDKVHQGELWIDRGTTSRMFLRMAKQRAQERDPEGSNIAKLTVRERQTVAAVARHVSAPGKVLADRLCISEHTLRNHLSSIYTKLGLSSRLDLYAYATTHNLCGPD